jgi:putative endonuclease
MYFVYILASRRNGTLYTGVTNDLHRRIDEHRSGHGSEFTRRYRVTVLVWFEVHERIDEAIAREKQIKRVEPILEAAADRALQSRVA